MKQQPQSRWTIAGGEARRFLELLGVCAFVVAQPVLDVFGRSPETFAFAGASTLEIVAFAVAVAVVPPFVLWMAAVSVRPLGQTARRAVHLGTLAALFGFLAVQAGKRFTGLPDLLVLAAGLLLGSLAVVAIGRFRPLKESLPYAAVAAPAFVLLFLLATPVSRLAFGPKTVDAAIQRDARPVSTVFVVFDQLPTGSLVDATGRINSRMYPNFARLARSGTWYRNYSSVESYTTYAVPSLLTGRVITDRPKAAISADHPQNLFTLAGGRYRMHVSEANTSLCPPAVCGGKAEQGGSVRSLLFEAASVWSEISVPFVQERDITAQFTERDDGDVQAGTSRRGRRNRPYAGLVSVPVRFPPFVQGIRRREAPTLHFIHLVLPHYPWNRFPSGRMYETTPRYLPLSVASRPQRWLNDPWAVRLTRSRHLLQTRYTDALLGVLLRRLRRQGLFDDTLIVVTADHGHSFQPGQVHSQATPENAHDVLWVPLIIKEPGQRRGRIDDRNLMAPDLLPTVADILDLRIPWQTNGRSAEDARYSRGDIKVVTAYADPPRVPGPNRRLTIRVADAWRRILHDAFRPTDPSASVDLWPFLIPPGDGWVGRPIPAFTGGPWADTARLTYPADLRKQLGSDGDGRLPAFIAGRIDATRTKAPGMVGVALNGRVAGLSTLFTQDGVPNTFEAVIPERFFRSGQNELTLFAVDGRSIRPIRFVGPKD